MSKRIRKTVMCPNCWTIINYDIEEEEEGALDALVNLLDPVTAWPMKKLLKLGNKKDIPLTPPYFCPNCNTFFN